jgi:ribulose-phosphate 3-epimerase
MPNLTLQLGVKSDPVEYRYSYEWLFRLLSEEGVRYVQLGTFFELYQLPDKFFKDLRRQAEDFGLRISSLFTAHRELGGFFREELGFVEVARKNFERYIEIGGLLGADSVGSNPGAVMRDRMGTKEKGIEAYLSHMKELLRHAKNCGVATLGIEPMSCLAEPPTLPDEMKRIADELMAFHHSDPEGTSRIGFCLDVAHGYADREGNLVHTHLDLLEAAIPYTTELHLKNTDSMFNSTFGFSEEERTRGIIKIQEIRDLILSRSDEFPANELIGYLEIGGPKLGRDYSDHELESQLRESIRYLQSVFPTDAKSTAAPSRMPPRIDTSPIEERRVRFAPSLMCCDQTHFEESVRGLERLGVDLLHLDIMDTRFAPNMPLGLEVFKQLRPKTGLPFDVHLMVEDNDFFIDRFAEIGVRMISVHAESAIHLDRTLSRIKDLGIEAGVALNPATPLSALEYVLNKLDFVMLMTVNPGYAGQRLVESTLGKIARCRRFLDDCCHDIPIEVDGNVSFENIPRMVAAGADILVAGTSSLFHPEGSLRENLGKTNEAIAEGLARRLAPVGKP